MSSPHPPRPSLENPLYPPPPREGQSKGTSRRSLRAVWVSLGVLVLAGAVVAAVAQFELPSPAQAQRAPVDSVATAEAPAPVERNNPTEPFRLTDLDIHPDRLHAAYMSQATIGPEGDTAAVSRAHQEFRKMLTVYENRAGVDDNFTIRVYDNRTWNTLEVYSLTGLRERYEERGSANWDAVDSHRRTAANELTRKWAARGVPRPNVALRWGRKNQVLEAREREAPTIEYEIRLARQLGMSLLAAEIGTVETFNQDWLVSTAKAKSRYQMMPDILNLFGIETYSLPTKGGQSVTVREELHPLLALQSAFLLLKGYVNAVGHEIPGISAYHTGPGNIYHLYETYLQAHRGESIAGQTVADAYMWGVTDGFTRVREGSSFGNHSRGYVLSGYGALRTTEDLLIDPKNTLRADQVQFKPGATVTLDRLLTALAQHEGELGPMPGGSDASLYERFRLLNPHMALPRAPEGEAGVPAAGNVVLSAEAGGHAVRFYLPYGASEILPRIGLDLIDPVQTIRFDETAFRDPEATGEKTAADREYDELVADIGRFGFNQRNQNRLARLHNQMQQLAEESPTPYRQRQSKIITIHRRMWGTKAWRDLAAAVAAATGAGEPAPDAGGRAESTDAALGDRL